MSDTFKPHHLPITAEAIKGNSGHGRLIFLPGSDGRARRISEHFSQLEFHPSDRQLNVYLGRIGDGEGSVDVAAISSGMGCPSLNIVVTELIMLGARLFIRVGSSGSVRPDAVRVGSLVIANCGVRNESTSDHYVSKDYPAIADTDMVGALSRAACRLGYADRTFVGPVLAKDALYALEFGHGPRAAANEAYMAEMRGLRVLASDMETSHLFILSHAHSTEITSLGKRPTPGGIVKSGAVVAVIGDDTPFAPPEAVQQAEQMAIATAVEGALELFRAEQEEESSPSEEAATTDRDVERGVSPRQFVETLRRVADSIEQDEPVRIQVQNRRLIVPKDASLSIEHEVEGGQEELELQLKWSGSQKQR